MAFVFNLLFSSDCFDFHHATHLRRNVTEAFLMQQKSDLEKHLPNLNYSARIKNYFCCLFSSDLKKKLTTWEVAKSNESSTSKKSIMHVDTNFFLPSKKILLSLTHLVLLLQISASLLVRTIFCSKCEITYHYFLSNHLFITESILVKHQ